MRLNPSVVFILTLAGSAALCATAAAQGTISYFPSDTPGTGPCSNAPFGSAFANAVDRNQRWQTLVTAAELGNVPRTVSSIAFAPCGAGVRDYDRLVVKMNHINGPLTTDMTANLGGGSFGALDVSNHVWEHGANGWVNIGLNRSFAYDPARGDLIVEVRVVNADFPGNAPGFHTAPRICVLANNYAGALPRNGVFVADGPKFRLGFGAAFIDALGVGCGPGPITLNWSGSSAFGTSSTWWMTQAGPGTNPDLGAIWVGFQRIQSGLGGIGATGCSLYASLDFSVIVQTTNGTSTSLVVPIPVAPALAGGRFLVQGAHVDPTANPFGIELTGAAIVVVGQ